MKLRSCWQLWKASDIIFTSPSPFSSPHFEVHLCLRHWRRQKWGDERGVGDELQRLRAHLLAKFTAQVHRQLSGDILHNDSGSLPVFFFRRQSARDA